MQPEFPIALWAESRGRYQGSTALFCSPAADEAVRSHGYPQNKGEVAQEIRPTHARTAGINDEFITVGSLVQLCGKILHEISCSQLDKVIVSVVIEPRHVVKSFN